MRQAWDYKRALEELWRRSSYERGLISDPFGDAARAERGLERMRRLLAALGDPQVNLPTVHIAGSKGKGSTGAFIASVAKEAGHRAGFYTSPDRKSTRLNSSHANISYAVFCLKKKTKKT